MLTHIINAGVLRPVSRIQSSDGWTLISAKLLAI